MSWYRRIKFLYTVFFQLLFFVTWYTFGKIFFQIEIIQNAFLISLLGIFIMEYIIYITNKKTLAKRIKLFLTVIIPIVICLFLIWIINNSYFVFYSIFIILSIIISYKFEEESVDYYTYKDRVVKGLLLFLLLGIVITLSDKQNALIFLKYYIFIIIISILLLRESRRYTFKIKSKNNFLYNIIISLIILIASIDKIYLLFKKFIILIFKGISYLLGIIVSSILNLLIKLLEKPIKYIMNFVRNQINKHGREVLDNFFNAATNKNVIIQERNINEVDNTLLDYIITVLILALIFFIIYKIVIGRRNFNINKNENIIEEKEKIKRNRESKNFIGNMLKKIFKGKKEIKVQIRDVYRQFEEKTDKKKIFKTYMTATQLNNVTKLYVDNIEDLDSMSIIYNEAKFSQHDMNESDLKAIKDNYENVKKQLQI